MVSQLRVECALEDLADQISQQATVAGERHPDALAWSTSRSAAAVTSASVRRVNSGSVDASMPAGRSFVTGPMKRSFPAHDHKSRTIRTNPGYTHAATVPWGPPDREDTLMAVYEASLDGDGRGLDADRLPNHDANPLVEVASPGDLVALRGVPRYPRPIM